MKRKLRKDEYMPFAPEHVGIVRANHQSDYCVGDSLSMIVERKDDGSVAAHCFRCGSGGYSFPRLHYRDANQVREGASARRARTEGLLVVGGLSVDADASSDYERFPAGARTWLSRAGLTKEKVNREDFLWSEDSHTLYIPVRQLDNLVGYVLRQFEGENRYRTLALDKSNFFGYYRSAIDKPSSTVVIVEDVLSGLRVSQICDTIVALGTNLMPAAVSTILRHKYENAVIFLDADNGVVRSEARRMAKKLPFLNVRHVEVGRDPKYHSDEQLRTLITLK